MKERPILFSGPMVRALLDGRKTQTRRIMKPQPPENARYTGVHFASDEPDSWFFNSPSGPFKYRVSCSEDDHLWVRETWQTHCDKDAITPRDLPPDTDIQYPATYDHWVSKKRPGIHMPRWASRITLKVTDVRVQRLQDISEADAKAEGVERLKSGRGYYSIKHGHAAVHFGVYHNYAKEAFAELWDHINGAGAWDANPWVYALTFEVEKAASSAAGLKSAEGAMRSKLSIDQVA